MTGPRKPQFEGGSPVTQSENPFSAGAGADDHGALGSLPVEERADIALDDLTAYSEPITSDTAADRPIEPPTTTGGSRV